MIDGKLRHHFRDADLIKRPRWARSLYAKISEVSTKLTGELGRPPLVEEIASEVNVPWRASSRRSAVPEH
jgi:RNA polymerase sigma-B factor